MLLLQEVSNKIVQKRENANNAFHGTTKSLHWASPPAFSDFAKDRLYQLVLLVLHKLPTQLIGFPMDPTNHDGHDHANEFAINIEDTKPEEPATQRSA